MDRPPFYVDYKSTIYINFDVDHFQHPVVNEYYPHNLTNYNFDAEDLEQIKFFKFDYRWFGALHCLVLGWSCYRT